MKNWQIVFFQELRNQFRRRAYLFSTFGVPLLILLGFGGYLLYDNLTGANEEAEETIQTEFEDEKRVGYVDLTGEFPAPSDNSPFSDYITRYEDFENGEAAVKSGDISRLFVIEADYFETGRVNMWIDSFSLTAVDNGIMEAFLLTSMAKDTDPKVIARLRAPATDVVENRITRGSGETRTGDAEQDFWLAYVFAILLMTTTFGSSGYLMQSVVEEKENSTIEIILTSVKPAALLMGKVLAMALSGLFQTLLWIATMMIVASQMGTQFVDFDTLDIKPEAAALAVIYFILGYGLLGGFFAAIGSVTNTTREGSGLSSIVVLPSIVPLFFITAIAEDPNGTAATILSFIPFTAPLTMVMRVALAEVPAVQIVISILLMLVGIVFSMWLAVRLFRVSSLLRGTTPRLKDIPRLIFQS